MRSTNQVPGRARVSTRSRRPMRSISLWAVMELAQDDSPPSLAVFRHSSPTMSALLPHVSPNVSTT